MKTLFALSLIILVFGSLTGCSKGKKSFAYNGRLDADVIRLSAKVAGTVDSLTVREGDAIQKDQLLVKIDDRRLRLQLKQQQSQLQEITTNLQVLESKEQQIRSQLNFNLQTLNKTQAMLKEGAATRQQVDQLQTQVDVLKAQLAEARTNKKIVLSKKEQLQAALDIVRLNLQDIRILAPVDGLVINRFIDRYENVAPGSPLLEIADLRTLKATIYVPLTKLHEIKIGNPAKIKIDGFEKTFPGKIRWIASEAEFTPKTILTEETRTSLVYAVQIEVPNPDQKLKIGMPVEVFINE